ncbi:leucine-rich repeat domain-containing protein [Saprospiraceae bacterium]|jgi:gliding motility-associated-like protein|nr:leucine-rich repeat domain-containing protein [Saprospiraceae bacterium]
MRTVESFNYALVIFLFILTIGAQSTYVVTEKTLTTEEMEKENIRPNRAADSLMLVDFYQKTNGDGWIIKWDLSQPIDTWFGVELNDSGCVKCLDLDGEAGCNAQKKGGNGLKGSMIDLNLPFLEHIFLAGNQLNGEIPNFTNLPYLLTLQLSCNRFTGTIPNFKNMPRLNSLELDYNQLTGKIPDFNQLGNLENLYLSNNQLTGVVPNFDNLWNLKRLYLHKNQLSGEFPSFSAKALERLILFDNQFEGSIISLSLQKELTHLNLSNNRLSGKLNVLTQLPHLRSVVLGNNDFSGEMASLEPLGNLVEIDLSNNKMSGSIPKFKSPILQTVLLTNNHFDKSTDWKDLPALSICSLSGNSLWFDDLMPYKNWLKVASNYEKQTISIKDTLVEVHLGEKIILNPSSRELISSNIYKWYHDGQQINSMDERGNLIIEKTKSADLGTYYCKITNTNFPSLELSSRQFILAEKSNVEVKVAPILENDHWVFDYDEHSVYNFDLTENDLLSSDEYWDIQILSIPDIGVITSLEEGLFELKVPPGFSGIIDFEYEVCNVKHGNLCDAGIVEIEINKPVNDQYDFLLPGNFSPNKSIHSETYIIPALAQNPALFTNPQLIIYNRNGQPVFDKKPYENDWQGTYLDSNVPLPMGIYYYQFIWEDEGRQIKTGSLMLIR